jgi:glycosyltransferase involved in cell wall biosynthesis
MQANGIRQPVSVAFVSSYGTLGGSEVYLERLIANLDQRWVGGVISLGHGPLVDRLRALGPMVEVVPTSGGPGAMAASAWKVRRALHKIRPDVVHANGLKAALVTVLGVLGTRISVIWVRHDFSLEGWRARILARLCTRVICVSRVLARTFPRNLARKVEIVHTGIPGIEQARDSSRRHLTKAIAGPEPETVISLVGRLVPWKGHLELIDIAPAILERLPNARILFIGGVASPRFAAYVDRLKARIEEQGLEDAIMLLGHRDDVLRLIAGSDVVVVPSVSSHPGIETEGFPLLALEALSLGTPVVAYRVGGIPEAVGDCGSLVQPGDREGLSEAIVRLGSDRELRERMSLCGRERVIDRFSVADMVAGLQRVYSSAATRG